MVYKRKNFSEVPFQKIVDLVASVGMGTLLTIYDHHEILTTNFAIELKDENGIEILGHLAKANKQSKTITHGSTAKIIVQGPHGYISPLWYDHENVPTWDYASIQFKGSLEELSDTDLIDHLNRLVHKYEAKNETKKDQSYSVSPKMYDAYLSAVKGFRLTSVKVEPIFKLSQDKSIESVQGVVNGLRQRNIGQDVELAKLVKSFIQHSQP